MNTLIELYDERPIENVLATEVFRPERTVFLCPAEVAQNKSAQRKLEKYFRRRGVGAKLIFMESSLYNSAKVLKQLRSIADRYPDCVLDVTGGTDAALFAGGQFCAEAGIAAFTYSRRRGRFYNIHNAPFADEVKCTLRHSVEDCFLMAGGALRCGRVDNAILGRYMECIEPFFAFYMRQRVGWTHLVNYIQRASQADKGEDVPLNVDAPFTVKGERGSRIDAPVQALYELEELGFISNVRVSPKRVAFRFADAQIRAWLRDSGSVLELYVYKACLDTGLFNDVRSSAVVDWEGSFDRDSVTNEIDVMAMRGITPVFISCKTCSVGTEALNELAILRGRFGGHGARAAVVTTQRCRSVTRHRASELDIDIFDLDDLRSGSISESIAAMTLRV